MLSSIHRGITVIQAKSISAVLNDTLPTNVKIESFTDCTNFYLDNLSKDTGAILYLSFTVSMVYLLNDIAYSSVLRLFVSECVEIGSVYKRD